MTEACNFEHVVELADNDHALTVRPARGRSRSSFFVVIATLGSIYARAARKLNILCYQPASVLRTTAQKGAAAVRRYNYLCTQQNLPTPDVIELCTAAI